MPKKRVRTTAQLTHPTKFIRDHTSSRHNHANVPHNKHDIHNNNTQTAPIQQDDFHAHNTRTHTSSHNGNTHNQHNRRDTHTKRRQQPVSACTTVKNNTIIPSTQNIEKIHATKQPHNRKTLRSFLKTVNAYKEFIPDHARLRTPLVNLLKKDVMWVWDDECQKAFTSLKESLTTHPTLHLYQEGLPCQVYCNTSTLGIAGILKQVYPDGKTYTVQHFSRSLRSHERNYSDLELQCLAIVESVDNFRACLMGRKFTILSDHPALQWLKEIKAPSGRLFRWRLRLSRYEYETEIGLGLLLLMTLGLPHPVREWIRPAAGRQSKYPPTNQGRVGDTAMPSRQEKKPRGSLPKMTSGNFVHLP
ncbi:K02A2.6-like [Cordylochernes scorpioides]|uniref:K02A2.6-like n=1 Tax=Cordylochernes scorpioides TaxID=51811 RepID=A0ABY6K9T0_9ARAC|nr:K02A2.6-like [Cordylochernes scorpioides]